uniref:Uncharacterized protein n=1 Tax=Arundo donax TaxID=35708 RepID=A0A0A8ZTV8_ARUDO
MTPSGTGASRREAGECTGERERERESVA